MTFLHLRRLCATSPQKPLQAGQSSNQTSLAPPGRIGYTPCCQRSAPSGPRQGGPGMPLLEVRGLVKYYGRRKVVDGVDFEVDAGEVVGLLGPNGAGKTTSFRMATGQVPPNAAPGLSPGQPVPARPSCNRSLFARANWRQAP